MHAGVRGLHFLCQTAKIDGEELRLEGSQEPCGKRDESGNQLQHAAYGDSDETERQQKEPHEWIEDERQQSEGPAEDEEQAPKKKFDHTLQPPVFVPASVDTQAMARRFHCEKGAGSATCNGCLNLIQQEAPILSAEESEPVPDFEEQQKHLPESTGLTAEIRRRWSPRAFTSKPVSQEDLRKLFEAARWAPSSYNDQPWRFIVGVKGDSAYQRIFDSLVEFNQMWAKSAPVLILTLTRKDFSHSGKPNHHGMHDLGLATAMLMVEATHLGLHTHGMAGYDHAKARSAFGIPEEYEVGAVLAVGYVGDPESLPEGMREREVEPRQRKPLDEIVLTDWAKPATF